jgi:predicted transcriptional regulator
MLRISDIMTREVFILPSEVSTEEAAWGLIAHHVSGAPVRASDGRLIGVLSKTDLADPDRNDRSDGKLSVGELMTPAIFAMHSHEPAINAVCAMVREKIHRVLVTDREGTLVGIVTPMDVLTAMANGERFDVEPHHASHRRAHRRAH